MGTFRDDLLPDIEDIRAIPGEFGLRVFEVYVRLVTSDGARVGIGARTVTETQLLVGGQNPKVKQMRGKDVVAGKSELEANTFEIGPLTPGFTTPEVLNPEGDGRPKEVYFVIKGPGLPTTGLLCVRTDDDTDAPFRYMLRVKSSGRRKGTP